MDGRRESFVICTVGGSNSLSTLVESSNKKIKWGQRFVCVLVFARLLGLFFFLRSDGANG